MVYSSNIERVKRSCELIRRLSEEWKRERQGVTEMKRKSRTMPYSLTRKLRREPRLCPCVSDGVAAAAEAACWWIFIPARALDYSRQTWPDKSSCACFSLKRKEEKDVGRKIWVCPKKPNGSGKMMRLKRMGGSTVVSSIKSTGEAKTRKKKSVVMIMF